MTKELSSCAAERERCAEACRKRDPRDTRFLRREFCSRKRLLVPFETKSCLTRAKLRRQRNVSRLNLTVDFDIEGSRTHSGARWSFDCALCESCASVVEPQGYGCAGSNWTSRQIAILHRWISRRDPISWPIQSGSDRARPHCSVACGTRMLSPKMSPSHRVTVSERHE
jgi:hypothetical protein